MDKPRPSNFQEWIKAMPSAFTQDALWQMQVYRQSLFLGDLAWFDVCKLHQDKRQLLIMVPAHRQKKVHEEAAEYAVAKVDILLAHIPYAD